MVLPEHLHSGHMEYTPDIIENVQWPPHFHHNMELIYILEGSVLCTATGQNTLLQKDDFAFFLSNEPHSYMTFSNSRSFVLVFAPDYIPHFVNQVKSMRASSIRFHCSDPLLSYVRAELVTKKRLDTLKFKSCLYGLASEYLKQVSLYEQHTEKFDSTISAVTNFISQNYQNSISLADMARTLSFNYSYLSRHFHNIFFCNFPELVNRYRTSHAIELLTNSNMKISDIALDSGFQSIRAFNDCFRKQTGMTPREFRSKQSTIPSQSSKESDL